MSELTNLITVDRRLIKKAIQTEVIKARLDELNRIRPYVPANIFNKRAAYLVSLLETPTEKPIVVTKVTTTNVRLITLSV
jgi:hypothetical protein